MSGRITCCGPPWKGIAVGARAEKPAEGRTYGVGEGGLVTKTRRRRKATKAQKEGKVSKKTLMLEPCLGGARKIKAV